MEEKIKKINNLNNEISELSNFLWILENSNIKSEYSEKNREKINEFYRMEIGSYIWTGYDNPYYSKRIENREIINIISDTIKPIIKIKISEKEIELKSLLK